MPAPHDPTAEEAQEGAAPSLRPPPVGDARYEDRGLIGRGGQGDVRRVFDRHVGRLVAMKILAFSRVEHRKDHARFWNEARVTANLHHPTIVPIHDMGVLPDGRPYFTMAEVRGRTFTVEIRELHAQREPLAKRRALRRLVEALIRVCEGVAYAHSRGIVHRDLKPHNLMMGRFGEVMVMDWGLAARLGPRAKPSASERPPTWSPPVVVDGDLVDSMALPTGAPSEGDSIAGTITYMAPEQARGDRDAMGPWSDVYALGAVLFHMQAGHPPYGSRKSHAWVALLNGPPAPLSALDASPLRPQALQRICEAAMAREPNERMQDAQTLARQLRDWLDDVERHDRAQSIVAAADAMWLGKIGGEPGIRQLRTEEAALRRQAERMLVGVDAHEPLWKKKPAWALLDQAEALERTASVQVVEWQQVLRSALNEVPDLPAANRRLADYYRHRLERAQDHRDAGEIARAEALLRAHDDGTYADYLQGGGRLTLRTEPAGATVTLHRYRLKHRRLVTERLRELGPTPLIDVPLASGSYLLIIRAKGCQRVRYPVFLPRAGQWACDGPEGEPHVVRLPRRGELASDEVYVPGGPFLVGGDPDALESLPRSTPWIASFAIQRRPVSCRQYQRFLNTLVDQGREEEAVRHAPKRALGHASDGVTDPAWRRDADGHFGLDPTWDDPKQSRWPVTLVDWHDAQAYAAWLRAQSGLAWRLPSELEWEKAARGVDGRIYPWGDYFDPSFACLVGSRDGALSPSPVDDDHHFQHDCSPYGVRGMAGNVRDWCQDRWNAPSGLGAGESDTLVVARGGAWTSSSAPGRVASRFTGETHFSFLGLGFRLARRLEADST
ncbi:MAG: bifunctional serine/threonine-protein kinase/formylglycine-generating enzyme family protein [Polyangiaceae bacterium]